MDRTTRQIVDYALGLTLADLAPETVATAAMRIFDSIGCALATQDAEPFRIALDLAGEVPADKPSGAVIGRPALRVAPDVAAFLNTTLIRYLDFNDWAPNGHPSDALGALLALAGAEHVAGQRLVTATVAAYEVFIALTEASRLPQLGWDQGFALGIATVAGLGNLLGLEHSVVANAVGIMATAGVPTGAARSGELSMWKGCATAFATRNAVFATLLARRGLTGPGEAFEGRRGLWAQITGPFALSLGGPQPRILRTAIKPWPVCYHGQAPVDAAIELRRRVAVADLASIEVGTYAEAWRSIGSEEQKWDPRSRETADHSLPYLVARALVDGHISPASFAPESYLDPQLRPLMRKITARADEAASAAYPRQITATIVAKDRMGGEHIVTATNPSGHPDRPMTWEQLERKFRDLAATSLGGGARLDRAVAAWRAVATADDVGDLLAVIDVTGG